jgi:hypothetical protein
MATYSVIKKVTLPLSKWVVDQEKLLTITSEIFTGKEIKGDKKMEPAELFNAIDLETGEEVQVIVGAVLKGILNDEYPNNGYVGKSFAIIQHNAQGKKYKTYSVLEIDVKTINIDDISF